MKNIFLFLLLSTSCFAQFSKTHYIPPLTCSTGNAQDHYLYISTPSTKNVNFKIFQIGGAIINGIVSKNTPYRFDIGIGENTQLFTPKTTIGIIQNKGYVIEAEGLIYACVRTNASIFFAGFAHAGGLVSKGNSALGKEFRLGAMLNPLFDGSLLNFASILATENSTTVTISNIPDGTILTNGFVVSGPIIITLNKNESYVLALENYADSNSNSSKMIGALVETNKPVVVNSGSFSGSNSILTNPTTGFALGRDVGFDQIVPFERTGREYIFVQGVGTDELERVILIAHKPNTEIFVNGNATPLTTLINPGDYIDINGSQFDNGNLYVTTSENVFAYQCIAGSAAPANQNLFFVPPINCATPNTVDNIPMIENIGNTIYGGSLNIVTEIGATVLINGNPIGTLPNKITGNNAFERYTVYNLSGNISVKSTKQVYVSYFGTNSLATYGGYYSGFETKPEIISDNISISNAACIPNVSLNVSTLSSYDTFQWYFNDVAISGSNSNSYTPTQPGYYQVEGSISGCPKNGFVFSDKIPVSNCPTNLDNDSVNDNVDLDNDNDGILNCTESFGNASINISNLNSGTITSNSYSNSFTGLVTTSSSSSAIPFKGASDGSFISEVTAGKTNWVAYEMTFAKPITMGIEYVSIGNATDLLNQDAEYIISTDIDKTITVLNPNDQLLIDTNYDGVFESGITQHSSFEIRFRLNNTVPLEPGTGTFQFLTYLANTISFTHKNLSEFDENTSTLRFFTSCVPKDSDGDLVADQIDYDSDNDGIPDAIESKKIPTALSNTDTNLDGVDTIFEPVSNPIDSDADGIPDYLDLDSDNDGIFDLVESGSNTLDSNKNGVLDTTIYGNNGLANNLETISDNGILNYTVSDTDADGIKNHTELDSDNDNCNDVIEAGFLDPNNDGILGNSPVTITKGLVTSAVGYTTPNPNYIIAAPILITTQPNASKTCELQDTSITIVDNGVNFYQWQISTNGTLWVNLSNNSTYSGVTTKILKITNVLKAMNGYQYRVQLTKTGNSCGLISEATTLSIFTLPVVKNVTIVQCDDNLDGITAFNLTVKNQEISTNSNQEIFTYYTTLSGANTADVSKLISSPLAYINTTPNTMPIWARVVNSNDCFSVTQINLVVSVTQINKATFHKEFNECDDTLPSDIDGFTAFDFQSVTSDILSILPSPSSNYSVKYYKTEADALSEENEIKTISKYRNTIINTQDIWVRIDSNLTNDCYGLGPFITLNVNPLPKIDLNTDGSENELICTNLSSFSVNLSSGINDGTLPSNYNYVWSKNGNILPSETSDALTVSAGGIYTVKVATSYSCNRTRTIKVTPSNKATITAIKNNDLSDNNSIAITVSGPGDYEYGIDGTTGAIQDSNIFINVPAGIHDIIVNDKNGCGFVSETIAVVGMPKFFTPNNDGINDFWNVKGLNATFYPKAIIYIFDRYGKLIKQISGSSQGWNGTFNGLNLDSDDYWYSIKLDDGREAKGHFTLKR